EESRSAFGTFDGSKVGGLYKGVGFRIPNYNPKTEEAKTFSLVWDWRPRQDVNLITNLYHSRIDNLIVTKAATDVYAIPGAILVSPETKGNAGYQQQLGLDMMVQWRFKVDAAWSGELWGSASWIDGRIDEGDGVAWEIPWGARKKFKLGATFRYFDRFSITPQLLVIGDTTNGRKRPPAPALLLQQQCTEVMSAPDRCTTRGYTLVNLHLGWHQLFAGRATVWLDVYNLFDRRYTAAHGSASRTFWDMPQQPRSWVASFEYRF
ncbi:MAG: TonB-dependent receptor, partial [Rhodocyclaceae bacterium]|nr:TonB-dependent receptor [Rhodocyclaceae bacterium]